MNETIKSVTPAIVPKTFNYYYIKNITEIPTAEFKSVFTGSEKNNSSGALSVRNDLQSNK